MSWFERYGIVGIYFVILGTIWLKTISNTFDFFCWNFDNIESLIAIGAGLSLPIGYFLSIISQLIYYNFYRESWQVHRTAYKKYKEQITNYDEETIESFTTLKSAYNKRNKEAINFIKQFSGKRWDVLVINQSMILATVLAPIVTYILVMILDIFSICRDNFSICKDNFNMLILYSTWSILSLCRDNFIIFILLLFWSIVSIWILCKSRSLMFRQIVYIYKRLSNDIMKR